MFPLNYQNKTLYIYFLTKKNTCIPDTNTSISLLSNRYKRNEEIKMKNKKFNSAPVSEVIFGITFSDSAFSKNNSIISIVNDIKDDFQEITYAPPIPDETLNGFKLNQNMDPNQTGPILYRLRNIDSQLLFQIQNNKVFLNWIRKDTESVGQYPGFTYLFTEFNKKINLLNSYSEQKPDIKMLELTYQDRIFWQDYITDLSDINKIMNITTPYIHNSSNIFYPNNIFSKYTVPLESLGGYAVISINTSTAEEKQILRFECTIRCINTENNLDSWYNEANCIQNELFNKLFTNEVLEKWQ